MRLISDYPSTAGVSNSASSAPASPSFELDQQQQPQAKRPSSCSSNIDCHRRQKLINGALIDGEPEGELEYYRNQLSQIKALVDLTTNDPYDAFRKLQFNQTKVEDEGKAVLLALKRRSANYNHRATSESARELLVKQSTSDTYSVIPNLNNHKKQQSEVDCQKDNIDFRHSRKKAAQVGETLVDCDNILPDQSILGAVTDDEHDSSVASLTARDMIERSQLNADDRSSSSSSASSSSSSSSSENRRQPLIKTTTGEGARNALLRNRGVNNKKNSTSSNANSRSSTISSNNNTTGERLFTQAHDWHNIIPDTSASSSKTTLRYEHQDSNDYILPRSYKYFNINQTTTTLAERSLNLTSSMLYLNQNNQHENQLEESLLNKPTLTFAAGGTREVDQLGEETLVTPNTDNGGPLQIEHGQGLADSILGDDPSQAQHQSDFQLHLHHPSHQTTTTRLISTSLPASLTTSANTTSLESPSDHFKQILYLMSSLFQGFDYTLPLTLILGFIILGTFVGNILVCLSVIKVRKLRHPSNYLLISLAISDLCVAVFVMPFGLYQSINDKWQLGVVLCNVYVVSDVTSCTASILNLCAISIDRYLAITRPLTYGVERTTRLMLIYIASVWCCAFLISGKHLSPF